jgi:hypothetical protein
MARRKIEGIETQTSEVETLRKENAELKARMTVSKPEPFEEIRKASLRNAPGSEISIKTTTDHKKISLYHSNGFHIGKRISQLHPNDLANTFERFKAKGVILTVNKPTEAEIETYKQTEEYKQLAKRQEVLKPHRYKKQSAEEMQRTVANFARLIGVKPEVSLKEQDQVKAGV